jgi:hypothetical protein
MMTTTTTMMIDRLVCGWKMFWCRFCGVCFVMDEMSVGIVDDFCYGLVVVCGKVRSLEF